MTREPLELCGELGRRHRRVGHAGVDRALWHARELRGRRILDQRDPVLRFDRLSPAVPSEAVPDRTMPIAWLPRSAASERKKNRRAGAARRGSVLRGKQRERAVENRGVGVGRDDVDVIALDAACRR